MNIIKFLIDNYAIISIIIPTIFGIFLFFKKWINYGIKSVKLSQSFHEVFGDFPAKKIDEIYQSIIRSSNTLELRQSITEKHIKIGIYICEAESGRCLWTNEFLNELFELDSEEMKNYGWSAAIYFDGNNPKEEASAVLKTWRDSIIHNDPYYATYKIKGRYTNKIKTITTHAVSIFDGQNQIICYIGYLYEISTT